MSTNYTIAAEWERHRDEVNNPRSAFYAGFSAAMLMLESIRNDMGGAAGLACRKGLVEEATVFHRQSIAADAPQAATDAIKALVEAQPGEVDPNKVIGEAVARIVQTCSALDAVLIVQPIVNANLGDRGTTTAVSIIPLATFLESLPTPQPSGVIVQ